MNTALMIERWTLVSVCLMSICELIVDSKEAVIRIRKMRKGGVEFGFEKGFTIWQTDDPSSPRSLRLAFCPSFMTTQYFGRSFVT